MVNSPTSREYVTLLDLHISTNGSHEAQKIPTTMSFQLVRTPYFSGEKLGVLKQASWKNYQILGDQTVQENVWVIWRDFSYTITWMCFVFFCIFLYIFCGLGSHAIHRHQTDHHFGSEHVCCVHFFPAKHRRVCSKSVRWKMECLQLAHDSLAKNQPWNQNMETTPENEWLEPENLLPWKRRNIYKPTQQFLGFKC